MTDIDAAVKLLSEMNAMILLPDMPLPGDFIALDWDESSPSDWGASWHCSQVLEVDGEYFKVCYDRKWYQFKSFGTPKASKRGVYAIYPALKVLPEPQYKRLQT